MKKSPACCVMIRIHTLCGQRAEFVIFRTGGGGGTYIYHCALMGHVFFCTSLDLRKCGRNKISACHSEVKLSVRYKRI
jgi:hypothetical protein